MASGLSFLRKVRSHKKRLAPEGHDFRGHDRLGVLVGTRLSAIRALIGSSHDLPGKRVGRDQVFWIDLLLLDGAYIARHIALFVQ